MVGFLTRWTALTLALFCVVSGLLFHFDLADQGQTINLMKNFAMAGGYLLLAQTGAPYLSIDALRSGGTKTG